MSQADKILLCSDCREGALWIPQEGEPDLPGLQGG
jgi:hypothetical protein